MSSIDPAFPPSHTLSGITWRFPMKGDPKTSDGRVPIRAWGWLYYHHLTCQALSCSLYLLLLLSAHGFQHLPWLERAVLFGGLVAAPHLHVTVFGGVFCSIVISSMSVWPQACPVTPLTTLNSGPLSLGTGVNPRPFLHKLSSPCDISCPVMFIILTSGFSLFSTSTIDWSACSTSPLCCSIGHSLKNITILIVSGSQYLCPGSLATIGCDVLWVIPRGICTTLLQLLPLVFQLGRLPL